MRGLSENPVVALLQMRARRRWSPPLWVWCAIMAVVPVMAWALPHASPTLRLAATLLWAGAYPLFVASRGAGMLAELRRGQCWEEVLGTGMPVAEMVDGLALYAVGRTARTWPVMLCAWWLWSVGPWGALYPGWVVGLGFVTQLVLAAIASYLAQAGYAWSRDDSDFVLRYLVVWSGLSPVVLVLAAVVWREVAGDRAGALEAGVAAVALAGLLARRAALAGVRGYQRLRRLVWHWRDRLAGARSGRLAGWMPVVMGANPVVFRELRAEARYVPGGWLGVLLWRHGLAAVLLGGLTFECMESVREGSDGLRGLLWLSLVVLLVLQTVRAAYRTVGSLVDEREAGTLESLIGTSISAVEWVDGWAAVSIIPRTLENLVAALAMVGVAGLVSLGWLRFGVCAVLLLSLTAAAAYAGVGASAASATRHQALDRIGVDLAAGLWLLGVLGLLLALQAPAVGTPVALLLGLGTLVRYRSQALRLITTDQLMEQHADLGSLIRRSLQLPVPDGFESRLWTRFEEEPTAAVIAAGLRQTAPDGFSDRLMRELGKQGLIS